ncbi:TolC family protein [Flavobacterium degerlachei]|jgi:outer membrane protein|uniref:Outer membrane protein n=1 Tax=Flavobacterium degerlachei TaxID=229203 RepID=A0A1H3F159_9FLAO|nr:TolC family protein [Flavobacterium degerlachei]SDX84048.1 outer membrane protein [Flavobacterium degerlachei]
MNRKRVLTVVFLAFCTFASGQEVSWSLIKCFETALQNNIEIKIRQLEIKKTLKSQNSILNRMLPTVSLYGEQQYSFGSTIDPSTNGRVSSNIQNDNFYINTRTNLIDFSAFANAQKDKISIEIAKAEKEVIENEYKLQLLESYYQTLYTQELIKIQKEQLKQATFNLDRISKEVAIGSKPQSDLYDMQLSFSEEENSYLETQQLYGIQKTQLFQLINVSNVETDAVILEIYFDENNVDNIKKTHSNPKKKLAEFQYQNSLKTIHLERANNLPVLSAYYGYSTFYYKNIKEASDFSDSFSTQLSDNKNQEVGMQLMIPVFNGFRNNKKIIASKIESEKAKLVINQEKQELDKQVVLEEQNKKNYLLLQEKLNDRLSYAKASFNTMQAKFTNGRVEAILYSSVKNQFLSAKYDLIKNSLQLQYIILKINLLQHNSF